MDFLPRHIECLIFCAKEPISLDEIQHCLSEMFETIIDIDVIEKNVNELIEKYNDDQYAFEVANLAGGYQFLTKPAYQASVGILLKQKSKKRLSPTALETLAIIAYKQPVTKTDIEVIRGVSSDYAIQKLLEKELIEIRGKSDTVGKPLMYGTSPKFMEYFGINSMSDLPVPKDFVLNENEIGQNTSEE